MSCLTILKAFIVSEQGVPHFCLSLGPTKYVAGSGWRGLRNGEGMSISEGAGQAKPGSQEAQNQLGK